MRTATWTRGAIAGAALGLLSQLAACNGVDPTGDGGGPVAVRIQSSDSTSELQTVECAATQLTAIATFTGGSAGDHDVSTRVTWTSSNPGVIDVSNGEIETAPASGDYFPAGTVIARTTGDAIIRADYAGLYASFSVSADAIASMRISPALTRMAPDSQTNFRLYVRPKSDRLEQDFTDSATWRVPSNSSAAEMASYSTVQAHANPLETPFTVEARLYACDRSITRELRLSRPLALQLSYEQPQDAAVPLVLGDRIRVDAVFDDANAPPQNLSAQVNVETASGYAPDIAEASATLGQVQSSDDDSTCNALSLTAPCTYLELNDYVQVSGLQKNKVVQLSFGYDPSGLNLSVLSRPYLFADTDATSLRLAARNAQLQFPNLGQAEAYAGFADGIERPVTRYVSWSTEDSDLLSVTRTGIDGGLLVPQNLTGTARIYGSLASAAEGEIEEDLSVSVRKQ